MLDRARFLRPIAHRGLHDPARGVIENTAGAFDAFMLILQVVGLIVFIAAVVITGWNAWLTWRDGRKWTAKTWNTLIAVSSCVMLYVAVTFKLVSMTVNY